MEPAISPKAIKEILHWAAVDALPKRLELRCRGERVGKPIFIAMDELPSIVAKVPEAPGYMGEIGREGRKVGIFMISSAQDFLVRTIGAQAQPGTILERPSMAVETPQRRMSCSMSKAILMMGAWAKGSC